MTHKLSLCGKPEGITVHYDGTFGGIGGLYSREVGGGGMMLGLCER